MPLTVLDVHPFFGRRAAALRGWRRWVLALAPLHAWAPARFELMALRARIAGRGARQAWRGRRDLLVNLGCGPQGKDGWANVDVVAAPGVNCRCDCRRGLPFEEGSVACIFTEHFVEHLDYTEEVLPLLSECHRVLAPGGVLRIVVPDAGRYLRAYATEGWEALTRLRALAPDHFDPSTNGRYRTKIELVNEVFRQAYEHKFAYDAETLVRVLRDAGFAEVVEQGHGRSLDPRLLLDRADRAHESLYVEARK